VLRAGVTEQHFAMSIRRAFDDPAAWGALLATAGRQVARIYAKDVGLDENQVLARILESFEAEMRSTGDPGTITPTS
jgi:hypothetical protein